MLYFYLYDILLFVYVVNVMNKLFPKGGINSWQKLLPVAGRKTVRKCSFTCNELLKEDLKLTQKVTILVDGEPKKVWVSARALKSGKVQRVY